MATPTAYLTCSHLAGLNPVEQVLSSVAGVLAEM